MRRQIVIGFVALLLGSLLAGVLFGVLTLAGWAAPSTILSLLGGVVMWFWAREKLLEKFPAKEK